MAHSGISKRVVGGIEIISLEEEAVSSQDEVTVDDLRLDREETLEYKRRVFRRLYPDRNTFPKGKYLDVRKVARSKGIDFPLTLEEFEDVLISTPVVRDDGATVPFYTVSEKQDRSTRISPRKDGIDLYYNKNLVREYRYR